MQRQKNFTDAEKKVLLDLILLQRNIIEAKGSDRSTILRKDEAWAEITQKYNLNTTNTRSEKSLRYCWDNMKKAARKYCAALKRGRTVNIKKNPLLKRVQEMMGETPLHSIQPRKRGISTMAHPLIAVCQMRSIADKATNLEVVTELTAEAKRRLAAVAFFPEACDYLADNKKDIVAMAEPLSGQTVKSYKEIAIKNNIWLSLGGIHEASDNAEKIYNTHILISNEGQLVATYRKIHLFDMDNKDTGVRLMESDYVLKGEDILPPVSTPIGKLALSICYDMRFPELSQTLRNMGAQILTYPSAFTYQTGAAHWEVMLRARAIENQCYVVAAAQTGTHNTKRVSWGHAMVVDPWGAVVAQCSDKTKGLAIAEIDLTLLERVRKNMPCEKHRRTDLYYKIECQKSI